MGLHNGRQHANGRRATGSPWFCSGCQATHPYSRTRTKALNGNDYCERTYYAIHDLQSRAKVEITDSPIEKS
jgi:hypothetical protein